MRAVFSKPAHAARARSGSGAANHCPFKQLPCAQHAADDPTTSPCPNLSADTVCSMMFTIGFKEHCRKQRKRPVQLYCEGVWGHDSQDNFIPSNTACFWWLSQTSRMPKKGTWQLGLAWKRSLWEPGKSVKLPYISWSHPLSNLVPLKCTFIMR